MRDFFKLEGVTQKIDTSAAFFEKLDSGTDLSNFAYMHHRLESPSPAGRWHIKDKRFTNVSFKSTRIERLEFTNCHFDKCLFLYTHIIDCRFTGCTFTDSNMSRFELDRVYIDPKAFQKCIPHRKYSNIAVYLFQELLNNSRKESQPDFANDSLFLFRLWKANLRSESRNSHGFLKKKLSLIFAMPDLFYRFALGYGVRLRNLSLTGIVVFFIFVFSNWVYSAELGLPQEKIDGFVDALYFSVVVVTTLGFGDIVPSSDSGRIIVSIQALSGFVFLATFTSMLIRRFSQ